MTVAEWEDGIPPDPISCLRSHRLSLYQAVKNLAHWAMVKATKAEMRGKFVITDDDDEEEEEEDVVETESEKSSISIKKWLQ